MAWALAAAASVASAAVVPQAAEVKKVRSVPFSFDAREDSAQFHASSRDFAMNSGDVFAERSGPS